MPEASAPALSRRRGLRGRLTGFSRWWLPAVIAVVFQLWGVYRVQPPPSEPGLPGLDKLGHFVAFGLPVLFVSLALDRTWRRRDPPPALRWTPRRIVTVVALVSLGHAVVSELVQGAFYRQRSGDPFDVLADAVGIAVGALLARLAVRR